MKSSLVELKPRNIVRVEKKLGVHINGHDNNYPTRMERLINSSPTAKSCAIVMAKFIQGDGFVSSIPMVQVGKNKGGILTIYDLLKEMSYSIAYHRGFSLHINYNINGEITSVTPVPFKDCRYGLEDTSGYKGKVVMYNNWDNSVQNKINKDDFKVFDVFNPSPEVVKYQIEKSGGILKYKGQILMISLDSSMYPLSTIDPAQDDADTEYQLQLYKNRTTRKGFVGKKVITTPEFKTDDEKIQFLANLKSIQGFDSAGDILHFESEFTSDDKTKMIDVKSLDENINTNLFQNWEQSISNNIRKCFNLMPTILIDFNNGAMGNNSGESMKMAQAFFNAQTVEERNIISDTLSQVFSRFVTDINPTGDWTINTLELIKEDQQQKKNDIIYQKQAELRGSVGGVTSILSIQSAVAAGTTSYDSGVAMLMYLFGYEEQIAKQILGNQTIQPSGNTIN